MNRWKIETSHMPIKNVIGHIDAVTLEFLRTRVQQLADERVVTDDRPAFGPLTFRYEMDSRDQVDVVHAYFTNKQGTLSRFMRLRKESVNAH